MEKRSIQLDCGNTLDGATPETIMKALIDYGSYRDCKTENVPKVFDDPYVAAMLLSENNKIIEIYRKQAPQEIHAEPRVMIKALESIDTEGAANIISEIQKSYETKSWLRGSQEVESFERLFFQASKEIKVAHNCDQIRLFSTLEPCRDYEAQPSCSCIICAAEIDEVYYGADDTNPKGQGRIVLETGRLPGRATAVTGRAPRKVTSNLLVNDALNANSLFYTVGSVVQEFFNKFDLGQSTNSNAYSIFSIKEGSLEPSAPDDKKRITHRFATGEKPPIYTAALAELGMSAAANSLDEVKAQNLESKNRKIKSGKFDESTVLVLKHPAETSLIDILYERFDHDLPLPKSIISTHHFAGLDKGLADSLKENGVTLFPHSFRKHYERFDAQKHVLLAEIRDEYRDHLFILLKFTDGYSGETKPETVSIAEPYESCFAKHEHLHEWLDKLARSPSRMTIFVGAGQAARATEFVRYLDQREAFQGGSLQKASVEIRISQSKVSTDDKALELARETIIKSGLSNRVSVQGDQPLEALDAGMVSKLLSEVSISPTAFSRNFLHSLSESIDWRDRRNAGLMLAGIVSKEIQLLSKLVTARLYRAESIGLNDNNWTSLCSYLNAIEDLPSTAIPSPNKEIEDALSTIERAMRNEIKSDRSPAWLVDLVWRWIACWAKHASNAETFAKPFEDASFKDFIGNDPFLLSQLVFYVAVNSEKSEIPAIFENLFCKLKPSDEAIVSTSVMLARTAFAVQRNSFPDAKRVFHEGSKALGVKASNIFDREWKRCELVWEGRLGSVEKAKSYREKGNRFACLANLRTVIPAVGRKSLEFSHPEDAKGNQQSWRGDQVKTAADTLTELSNSSIEHAIRGLIRDSDIGAKWAGVTCALGTKNSALENAISPNRSKAELHKLREVRHSLLIEALSMQNPHYWLVRETISNYRQKSEALVRNFIRTGSLKGDYGLPSLSSFPAIRTVFNEDLVNLHPEVRRELERYKKFAKRVALVLPPIEFDDELDSGEYGKPQNEGSPPLGLGQIATTLAAHGHYVEIIDAHRFKYSREGLAKHLLSFDIVGFSAVISTLSSISDICVGIANAAAANSSENAQPKIVIGGHAPTLVGRRGMPSVRADFIVRGAGEEAMLAIASEGRLDLDNYKPKSCEIEKVTSPENKAYSKKAEHSEAYANLWSDIPWTERLFFRSAVDEMPYEPAKTRNGQELEVHVVMTRGCNWNCSFCTEALIGGSYGEMRRSAEDVINEIQSEVAKRNVSRVQFVDDNVLPSAKRGGKAGRLLNAEQIKWTSHFLAELTKIRHRNASFSWRGIMRLEDFILYDEAIEDFKEKLSASGCNLLSFGIESGDEKLRKNLKNIELSELTNEKISSLMHDIKHHGIASKAYFILGGPGQTLADIESTIEFSICGAFDLAYFAIYKDFRELTQRKEKDIHKLDFDLYASRLDECLIGGIDELWVETLGSDFKEDDRLEYSENYKLLRQLGFSFQKHIKYNDYHELTSLYASMGFEGSQDYLRKLAQAYIRFYCRTGWYVVYAELLKNGY